MIRSTRFLAAAVALLLLAVFGQHPVRATDYSSGPDPEYLYYIEGTGAYYLPDEYGDMFFHLGKWYRRLDRSWEVGDSHRGPWSPTAVGGVPQVLADLPDDFREQRRLGLIPFRYVIGPDRRDDDDLHRHYRGDYYREYERKGYRRRWHPHGRFWFFVAPNFDDDDWEGSHRRRGRGRGGRR